MGVGQCCGYLIATIMTFVSLIVLICLQISYRDYFLATANNKKVTCVVTKAVYSVQFACECGPKCRAAYPCLLIYAKLNSSSITEEDKAWPVPVYDDDYQQVHVIKQWDDDFVERVGSHYSKQH